MSEEGSDLTSDAYDAIARYTEVTTEGMQELRGRAMQQAANLAAINLVISTLLALDSRAMEAVKMVANKMYPLDSENPAITDVRECIEQDFGVDL